MSSVVKFVPISGVKSESPLCYILDIDNFRFLLDCGWDEDCDMSIVEGLKPYVDCTGSPVRNRAASMWVFALVYLAWAKACDPLWSGENDLLPVDAPETKPVLLRNPPRRYVSTVDAVLISHQGLGHIGALPYACMLRLLFSWGPYVYQPGHQPPCTKSVETRMSRFA